MDRGVKKFPVLTGLGLCSTGRHGFLDSSKPSLYMVRLGIATDVLITADDQLLWALVMSVPLGPLDLSLSFLLD